jgi:hypothetical protein
MCLVGGGAKQNITEQAACGLTVYWVVSSGATAIQPELDSRPRRRESKLRNNAPTEVTARLVTFASCCGQILELT